MSDVDTWAVGEEEGAGKGAKGEEVRGERRAAARGRGGEGEGGRLLSQGCPSV